MAWLPNASSRYHRTVVHRTDDGRTLRHIPIGDLILHTELRVATEKNIRGFRCPCRDCKGGYEKSIQVIRRHHEDVGRDPFFKRSMLGGDPPEGYPANGIWVDDVAYDDDHVVDNVASDIEGDILNIRNEDGDAGQGEQQRPSNPLDEHHEVQRQVLEALHRGDTLHEEAGVEMEFTEQDDVSGDTLDGLEELYTEASAPLYTGSRMSMVSATIIILNMCTVFRVSNNFANELFHFLSVDLLPKGNKLPSTHYAARKSIRRLGLYYNNLHACPNGCVLFEEENANLNACPKCNKSRWMDGTTNKPSKVIRHFPLIPRLKRMWRSSEIASMLTGYTKHVSSDGVMRSVVDSPAWKHIDSDIAFGNFGSEARNMRLALALDGVNPFKLSNTNWSTWPVVILIYNLEPWFVTKKFFISLCILISGKQSPLATNIDVFIRPLLRELQELWRGVPALDFSKPEGNRTFTLRALLMWTISDFPAYGLISGLCCKGYKGCPPCGPNTDARMARTGDVLPGRRSKGSKIVYGGIRRFLSRHHPYRRNRRFNGEVENRPPPPLQTGQDVICHAAWRQSYLDMGGRENGPDDPVHITGVKRLSCLYELQYWQVSSQSDGPKFYTAPQYTSWLTSSWSHCDGFVSF